MKRLAIIITIIFSGSALYSQNLVDALRYSQNFSGGTARSVAMGGAFGALGADFGSLSINPAGIGVYRGSEFTITPGIFYGKTNSTFYGTSDEDYKYNFNLNNLGIVLNNTKEQENGWISGSIGFGYNRLNNFHNSIVIKGTNPNNSMADYFLDNSTYDANGNPDPNSLAPFWERLAFDAYVIDTLNGQYVTQVPYPPLDQQKTITTDGKIDEWVITAGGNYSNKLYIGASLGIQKLHYSENATHEENYGDWFRFNQTLNVHGTGYNFKFGLIYKPIQMLRIGAAIHTPTSFHINEDYYSTMTSSYVNGQTIYPTDQSGNKLPMGANDYQLITPFRAIGSVGLNLFKVAMLSVDYEYLDYSNLRLRNGVDGYNYTSENDVIRNVYKSTFNFKTGAEVRLSGVYLRGGFGYYGSPYKSSEINKDAHYLSYTGGIGIRDDNFSIDIAYAYTTHSEKYSLYTNSGFANLNMANSRVLATIGFRF